MGDTAPTPMLDIGPRIGCDVVNVVDVTRSIELFGRRYLDRTFTPHELQTCAGPARDQRLAARFAAKEAVVKVVRPGDVPVPWSSIEITRAEWGGCGVTLSGNAAELARAQDLHDFQVSISHEADVAIAMVIATRSGARIEKKDDIADD
ncbi:MULTISPECIES: holo-ACP synthase [unclassified Rhodococcus (in: high G+C Gram-positive bacteria)]|uniref:holo-ACP synthase n=1 Tax=unclassified Rhodococcus (in: high G+C Gram-positive bacteria) TaxID=192944 RepID=UPI0024B646F9|nr:MULTISPECIES: holo-ACP synthase [unclassified Rhodococcus (in: high G+C Gram-positive bacteria)]MDI9955923.1 holo-ACP synthase [Rhodococcus sp. IEGM 1237]MDI9961945.1 holo-ACP synthase [Rhodococcus sp. IEGM 1251]MDV8123989.1 holo-ACP synthase [Rhodococcus sp. IEGM 1304]